jgi:hypothetical protein
MNQADVKRQLLRDGAGLLEILEATDDLDCGLLGELIDPPFAAVTISVDQEKTKAIHVSTHLSPV